MKRIFLLCCLFLLFFSPANASIIRLDWKLPSDGLIIRDTETNLEWLHISQTFNLSVNDLMGQWFGNTDIQPLVGNFSEFRYPTKTEITQLYNNFGITTLDYIYNPDNWIGANIAFQALGISGTSIDMSVTAHYAQSIDSPGVLVTARIVTDTFFRKDRIPKAKADVSVSDSLDFDYKDSDVGSYLVRGISTVPIPSTLWLLGFGLLGLAGVSRKKS